MYTLQLKLRHLQMTCCDAGWVRCLWCHLNNFQHAYLHHALRSVSDIGSSILQPRNIEQRIDLKAVLSLIFERSTRWWCKLELLSLLKLPSAEAENPWDKSCGSRRLKPGKPATFSNQAPIPCLPPWRPGTCCHPCFGKSKKCQKGCEEGHQGMPAQVS